MFSENWQQSKDASVPGAQLNEELKPGIRGLEESTASKQDSGHVSPKLSNTNLSSATTSHEGRESTTTEQRMFTASAKDLKANSTDRSDAVQHASRVEEATACSSTRLAQCTGKIVTVQLSSKVAVVADCWRCRNNGIRLQRRDSCPTTGERKNAAQGAVPECVLTQWSNRSDQKQPNKWTSGNAVWCRFSALLH